MTSFIVCARVSEMPTPSVESEQLACVMCRQPVWRSIEKRHPDAKAICILCMQRLPPGRSHGVENPQQLLSLGYTEADIAAAERAMERFITPGPKG